MEKRPSLTEWAVDSVVEALVKDEKQRRNPKVPSAEGTGQRTVEHTE